MTSLALFTFVHLYVLGNPFQELRYKEKDPNDIPFIFENQTSSIQNQPLKEYMPELVNIQSKYVLIERISFQ